MHVVPWKYVDVLQNLQTTVLRIQRLLILLLQENPLLVWGMLKQPYKKCSRRPHIQVMRICSNLGKIFLAAMVYELYKTGMSEITFERLAITVSCICTSNGEAFPGWDILLKVGCKLGECRIILCEAGSKHRLQKLQLNFPSDDVAFALKDYKVIPWLAKYL
ncbi:hypothetical protein RJ641_034154 [Dillenia turbinata]|uniref:Origin recognition complex subunit 1 n=1 Tax=Dillenia turbinata TaxID=194707 RepID=A0AAN8ZDZ1_9MAGN